MLATLLFTCAWWIGLWDLRTISAWNVSSIGFYFAIAAGLYLQSRLVSPRISEKGEVDLSQFHFAEGRKYLIAYTVLGVFTVFTNAALGQTAEAAQWSAQNFVIAPMTLATGVAAVFIRQTWVQVVALVVQIGVWIWYFSALQMRLSG